MKRILVCTLLLSLFLSVLTGCNNKRLRGPVSEISYIDIFSGDTATYSLTKEEANQLLKILNRCKWSDGLCDCFHEYRFTLDSTELQYSPDDGHIRDVTNTRTTTLSEEDRIWFNNAMGIDA